MKRLVTAKRLATTLCALALTVAVGSAAYADCPAHAAKQQTTQTQGS